MIRSRYPLVSLVVFFSLTTAAKGVDKEKPLRHPPPAFPESGQSLQAEWEKREKLRQAVSLPRINIEIGYGVNSRGHFISLSEAATLPEPSKIAEIEKSLKGDVTDAERYIRLAALYSQAHQPAKGEEARHKAVALFRKQLEQHPDDTALELRLADALDAIEKTEEAEAIVRRVVKEHPNNWHGWLILGAILNGKSWQAIGDRKPSRWTGPETLLQSIRAAQPTPKSLAASQQYRRDAVACFDRAVHLAPGESEVYLKRGASRYHYAFLDWGLRSYKGEKVDFFACAFGREALLDLRRAVELNPHEYKGIGWVVWDEMMADIYDRYQRNPSTKQPKKLIDIVSQPTRNHVLEDLARLEKRAENPDKYKAAEATEVLGYLQFFLFADYATAEKSARRSLALDPKREAAWDLLTICLLTAEDYRKLAAVSRERLEHKDSARNRLILAKTYEHLNQLDKAEEVVRAGLQRESADFMLRLSLADLLLMRADPESLHEAEKLLYKMREDKLSADGAENRWANYTFACGIYCGLIDQADQARECLKAVKKRQPQYSGLADALKALEE